MIERAVQRFEDYKNALYRLEEGLQIQTDNAIIIDGIIQRFEFTFELAWKLMKDYLEYEGVQTKSPRSAIKEAHKMGIIYDGDGWIDMMVDRNKTSHIYDEQEANAVYIKIKERHIYLLRDLQQEIGKRLGR
ncbi:hypothetical protein H0A61_00226 [Koleobacter methoxysyntrophicus]|jgi:nucleotidyltransferase substrate binding protein (TIGR01987 family)|uniref:Nucleotidyltransferase substrate binding protein, HI0074 family n=1 Tax=Koleobacter methoxysyntrophicus TaxID=2751313 RepID=A0A8A0RK44_9FIRM|nr:nucleotidyltransferase substrate binding protein [Koleobacter methoxysyntrophicus]QSQ07909.1 hypothetical protein H0A61_00226 [Koleobacter methoxysyntrophicus]